MLYKFKKGRQQEIVQKAILLAGSERKLAKIAGIPKSSINSLKFEKRNLSGKYAKGLFRLLNVKEGDIKDDILEILPDNWGQQKGGISLIRTKKENGTFRETILKLNRASSKMMKEWHKHMRENEPEKYYKWQYERFKKIGGGYKFRLSNGVKVRNRLEKEVGDFLIGLLPGVQYEPYVNIFGKAYFPDFVHKSRIVEVTEWKHPGKERLSYLKRKIRDYTKGGYFVCFFIPKRYRKFYKGIGDILISDLSELQSFMMPP